jgi:hypothetical protein
MECRFETWCSVHTHSGVALRQRLIARERRVPALRANLALCHLELVVDDKHELDVVRAGLDAAEVGGAGGGLVLCVRVRVAPALDRGRVGALARVQHGRKVPAHLVADSKGGRRDREGHGHGREEGGGWGERAQRAGLARGAWAEQRRAAQRALTNKLVAHSALSTSRVPASNFLTPEIAPSPPTECQSDFDPHALLHLAKPRWPRHSTTRPAPCRRRWTSMRAASTRPSRSTARAARSRQSPRSP